MNIICLEHMKSYQKWENNMKGKIKQVINDCINYSQNSSADFYVNGLEMAYEFGKLANFVKSYDCVEKDQMVMDFTDEQKEAFKKNWGKLFFLNGLLLCNMVAKFQKNIDMKAFTDRYNYVVSQYKGKSVAFLMYRFLTLYGNVSSTVSGRVKVEDTDFRFQNLSSTMCVLLYIFEKMSLKLKGVLTEDDIYNNYFKPLLEVKENSKEVVLEKEMNFPVERKEINPETMEEVAFTESVSIPTDFLDKTRQIIEALKNTKQK